MSTVNDMVVAAKDLLIAVDELLATDVVETLPKVAVQLGIESTFNDGVSLLADLLRELQAQLARLENTVEQAAAIGGLFGLIGPLIQALGDMVAEGGAGLRDYGLDSVATVSAEIGEGFTYLAAVGPVVQTFLIEPADFEDLLARLLDLADRIIGLRTDAPGNQAGQEDAA